MLNRAQARGIDSARPVLDVVLGAVVLLAKQRQMPSPPQCHREEDARGAAVKVRILCMLGGQLLELHDGQVAKPLAKALLPSVIASSSASKHALHKRQIKRGRELIINQLLVQE